MISPNVLWQPEDEWINSDIFHGSLTKDALNVFDISIIIYFLQKVELFDI